MTAPDATDPEPVDPPGVAPGGVGAEPNGADDRPLAPQREGPRPDRGDGDGQEAPAQQ